MRPQGKWWKLTATGTPDACAIANLTRLFYRLSTDTISHFQLCDLINGAQLMRRKQKKGDSETCDFFSNTSRTTSDLKASFEAMYAQSGRKSGWISLTSCRKYLARALFPRQCKIGVKNWVRQQLSPVRNSTTRCLQDSLASLAVFSPFSAV